MIIIFLTYYLIKFKVWFKNRRAKVKHLIRIYIYFFISIFETILKHRKRQTSSSSQTKSSHSTDSEATRAENEASTTKEETVSNLMKYSHIDAPRCPKKESKETIDV